MPAASTRPGHDQDAAADAEQAGEEPGEHADDDDRADLR